MMLMMASMMPRSASVCRCDRDVPVELPRYIVEEFEGWGFQYHGLRTCVCPGMLFFNPTGSRTSELLLELFGNQSSVRPEFIRKSATRAEELVRIQTDEWNRDNLGAVADFLHICGEHDLYINKYLYPGAAPPGGVRGSGGSNA